MSSKLSTRTTFESQPSYIPGDLIPSCSIQFPLRAVLSSNFPARWKRGYSLLLTNGITAAQAWFKKVIIKSVLSLALKMHSCSISHLCADLKVPRKTLHRNTQHIILANILLMIYYTILVVSGEVKCCFGQGKNASHDFRKDNNSSQISVMILIFS